MRTIYRQAGRQPRLGGAITSLVTPFTNDSLDRVGLMALVEWQILSGVDGIVICGLEGEGPTLTAAERREVIATTVEIADGTIPVIVATGTNDTVTTIAATRQAQALGADAALVTLPYYSRPTQPGIIHHFEMIAAATDMPVIIDHRPSHTATNLTLPTALSLAALPEIIGIVDGTGRAADISAWRHALPMGFLLLSGDDETALASTLAGSDGVISAVGNVAPRLVAALQHAAIAGNLPAASALLSRLLPLFRALARESGPAAIKQALSLLGRSGADVRLPLVDVEPEAASELSAALAALQLDGSATCGLSESIPCAVNGRISL